MSPTAWVSFCANFSEDRDPADSRCEAVGQYLAVQLRQSGVVVTATDNWRDGGWSVDCSINDKAVYFFVSYYGKPPVQYVLCCTSDRGFIAWLRGIDDISERWELARAVHRIMIGDSHFREIRWYVENGWAAEGTEAWVAEPVVPDAASSS
jgi:hypothetical protein